MRPALTDYLTRMGQAPFQFPTPDGYPEAASAWQGNLAVALAAGTRALAANRIPGTRIDRQQLLARAGGDQALAAHILGRQPDAGRSHRARQAAAMPSRLLLGITRLPTLLRMVIPARIDLHVRLMDRSAPRSATGG
jgi:hypothetical protein